MEKKVSITQRVLNVWAIILIIWSIYRAKLTLPIWFDEFIAKPLVFILPVYIYITQFEKINFFKGVYLKLKSIRQDILLSLFIGLTLVLSVAFANYLKYKQLLIIPSQGISAKIIVFGLFIALATAISEEILSRGFILKRLYDESKNVYSAIFISSILFFFLHIPILFTNSKITGSLLLFFIISDLMLSFVSSFIFLERKSLVPPILIHAFYNFAIVTFV